MFEDDSLSISPFSSQPRKGSVSSDGGKKSSHWEQIYLPLEKPMLLAEREKFIFEFFSDTRYSVGIHTGWTAQSMREKQIMNTAKGLR